MKAIILAAGEGSRMRPLTYTRPKVMLPIANRPILEHLLIEAIKADIKEFIFIVGYHEEQVRDYFGDGEKWGAKIEYFTQRKQLGTADAVGLVSELIDSDFLMMNGDIIVKHTDISSLAAKQGNVISAVEVEDTEGLGLLELGSDRVIHIYEKVARAPSHMANAGLYRFTKDIFSTIATTPKSPRGEYEITDSLQILIDRGYAIGFNTLDYWIDLSYPWDMLKANESLLRGLKWQNDGEVEDRVELRGPVVVGKGTVIRSGAYVVGPVIIGEDCDIGPNCFIRPSTSIGRGCHIGASVEVKNSIIMNGSKVPHINYVGDSIIGEGCNLGAGTKIANLRLDEKEVTVAGKNTHRRKLGAIIGDNVETGINASINVGSMIGNNTRIGPGAIVNGVIAPDSVLF